MQTTSNLKQQAPNLKAAAREALSANVKMMPGAASRHGDQAQSDEASNLRVDGKPPRTAKYIRHKCRKLCIVVFLTIRVTMRIIGFFLPKDLTQKFVEDSRLLFLLTEQCNDDLFKKQKGGVTSNILLQERLLPLFFYLEQAVIRFRNEVSHLCLEKVLTQNLWVDTRPYDVHPLDLQSYVESFAQQLTLFIDAIHNYDVNMIENQPQYYFMSFYRFVLAYHQIECGTALRKLEVASALYPFPVVQSPFNLHQSIITERATRDLNAETHHYHGGKNKPKIATSINKNPVWIHLPPPVTLQTA